MSKIITPDQFSFLKHHCVKNSVFQCTSPGRPIGKLSFTHPENIEINKDRRIFNSLYEYGFLSCEEEHSYGLRFARLFANERGIEALERFESKHYG